MCFLCESRLSAAAGRRAFLLGSGALAAGALAPALAQVQVGKGSSLRKLVPAEELETAAATQYAKLLSDARAQGALATGGNAQLARLRAVATRLIPHTAQWNDRARQWQWEVNLLGSKQINAFCMPGGKIAFYTGILDQLKLTEDEIAMVLGHEMAHALREHARARLAKTQATQLGVSAITQLFGLGAIGQTVTGLGGQLLTLQFSREDETEADIVGLEIAARGGYNPQASVSLWQKMAAAGGGASGPSFLSTHPSGPQRIQQLQANVPKVQGLYQQARR